MISFLILTLKFKAFELIEPYTQKRINMSNTRKSLYGMRLLFALGVTIFHYSSLMAVHHDDITQPFFSILKYAYTSGGLGVEIFFIISGFTFYWIYSDKIVKKEICFKHYCINRISRIFPIYYFSTITLLVIKHLSVFLNKDVMPECNVFDYSLSTILTNLIGLRSGIFNREAVPYNPAAWSLSVEIFLYLLFFITMTIIKLNKWLSNICILFYIGIGMFVLIFETHYPILNSMVARGMICFFIGGLLYYLQEIIEKKKFNKELTMISCWILAVSLYTKIYSDYYIQIFLIFPIFLLLCLNCSAINMVLGNKIFVLGGKISYSIYLMQYPVMVFMYLLEQFDLINCTTKYGFIIYWITLLLVSTLTYYFIEVPSLKLIRKIANNFCSKTNENQCLVPFKQIN